MKNDPTLAIGDVASRAGVEPSAIRYYESLGLLPKPKRISGKRRYDDEILDRLALIALAKDAGFTMGEIKQLVSETTPTAVPAEKWKLLATRKLAELDDAAARLKRMRRVLRQALDCGCVDLAACAPILRGD